MEGISLTEFVLIGLFVAFLHGGIKAWQDKHIREDINFTNFFIFSICINLGLALSGKSWELGMVYLLCVGIYLYYNAVVIFFFYLIRLLKGLITQKEKGKEEVA